MLVSLLDLCTCNLLLPLLLQQQAEVVELVYTGGQPEGQRACEEQTLMPPLTGKTMGHRDLETGDAPEVEK